jgi:DNA-binding MarR family transcriptional regulator
MRPAINLMELIDKHGAISARDAADLLNLSRSQVGKKGHDLVARGWARVTVDQDDKRMKMFDLTRMGKKALDNHYGGNDERRHNTVEGVEGGL